MNVSQKIKEIRESKRITKAQMARAMELDPSYYNKLENRDVDMTVKQLLAFAHALGVEPGDLLDNDGKVTPQLPQLDTTSDLVGMWAYIWKGKSLWRRVFIMGKVNDSNYIVQFISTLTGEPNVARIVSITDMVNWQIVPTREIGELVMDAYTRNKGNAFDFSILPTYEE